MKTRFDVEIPHVRHDASVSLTLDFAFAAALQGRLTPAEVKEKKKKCLAKVRIVMDDNCG